MSSAFFKKLKLRSSAVLVGLLPFILVEIGLRLCGVAPGGSAGDPLSGFNQYIPLFEKNGGIYRTAKAREPFFPRQEFPVNKPANGFRIFCFGGSTVHGHPYQSDTAFPKWLEMELSASDPKRAIQAINCGGVSYASYRIAPLVAEVMRYQPDLIIVATGENEFLEDRTYEAIKTRSPVRRWIEDTAQSLRIVVVARNWVSRSKAKFIANKSNPAPLEKPWSEVQPRLDSPGGYASYHRDDAWHERVASQLEDSLRRIVSTCRAAHVPLMLVEPGSNLRDCPPYKSEHRAGLTDEQEREWQARFDEGSRLEKEDGIEQALANYRAAERIDPEYALLLFRIGRLLDETGDKTSALGYYTRARDQDICPLRTTTRHEEILHRVSEETKTPFVDAAALIAGVSMDGIPGNDWFLDHVHPCIGGDQLIAQKLAERIRELGIFTGQTNWTEAERQSAYADQMQKLGPGYLADGDDRVRWLEHWARRERLYEETLPRNAGAFLRAGFRHLELGDEENARIEIEKALKLDGRLAEKARGQAKQLFEEGRMSGAKRLTEWAGSGLAKNR